MKLIRRRKGTTAGRKPAAKITLTLDAELLALAKRRAKAEMVFLDKYILDIMAFDLSKPNRARTNSSPAGSAS